MEIEEKFAGGHALAGVANGHPGAAIPYDHRSGAVLLGRYVALEAGIVERMVLDMDGNALFRGIVAGAFRHRPAEQHPIEFQPEVVVQSSCPMLLDNEAQACWLLATLSPCGRFRGDAEVAFLFIALERRRRRRPAALGPCPHLGRCHRMMPFRLPAPPASGTAQLLW